MKKHIIKIVLIIFLINCLSVIFAADTKMTDSELKTWLESKSPNGITCYPYLLDGDVYSFNVNEYRHKIIINKRIAYSSISKKNVYLETYTYNNKYIDLSNKNSYKYLKEIKNTPYKVYSNNIYNIIEYEFLDNSPYNASNLELARDGRFGPYKLLVVKKNNNKIIWDLSYAEHPIIGIKPYVITIKEIDENNIILVYSGVEYIYVNYIHFNEKDKPIVETFCVSDLIAGQINTFYISNGEMVTNNILKLVFKDSNSVEYWKIKNDSEYIERHKAYAIKNKLDDPISDQTLIWYDGKNKKRDYILRYFKSLDYIDSPNEPTLKELQKKFPDKNREPSTVDESFVSKSVKDIVNKYKSDSNVYRFDVKLYPNKLLIEKIFTDDNDRDKFIEYETIDPKTKAINATPIFEKKFNFNNIEYISKIHEVLNSTSREMIIYHNNKIIWRQTYATGMEGFFGYPYREPEIYDIVKLNNNTYAILFVVFYEIEIDYVHTEYGYPVIERYNLPHVRVLSNSFGEIYPSGGHFINSDIVKLEWDDGNVIEYWKTRLNRDDIINNKKVCKDVNEKTYVKSLLWWNGVKMKDKSNFADYENGKSWDYINSPNEPTLKELQEKFTDKNIAPNTIDKNLVSKNTKDIVKKYRSDNNVYFAEVREYPNYLLITKLFSRGDKSKEKINTEKYYNTDSEKTKISDKPFLEEKANYNNIEYTLKYYDSLDNGTKTLLICDNKNKVIWQEIYAQGIHPLYGVAYKAPEIYDIVKINEKEYIVLFISFEKVKVDYVHFKNNLSVRERYYLPPRVLNGVFGYNYPTTGKLITNNIVRLEWKNYSVIEYWRVKLARKDVINNERQNKNLPLKYMNALIWWNGIEFKNNTNIIDHYKDRSWDYINSTNEPTSKELQKRFPDDNIK